ncbi:MAG: hypothetical protein WA625_26845, partial [Pseudolabrys sp.]
HVRLDAEDAEGAEQDDNRDRSDKGGHPRIAQGIVGLGPDHRSLRKVTKPDNPVTSFDNLIGAGEERDRVPTLFTPAK